MRVMPQTLRPTSGVHLTPVRGARAAIAMLMSLLVLEGLVHNRVETSAAVGTLLGVLFVAFCDLGPSLRIRARAMSAGTVVGALLMALGSWISGPWWLAAPTLGLITFLAGVLAVYGPVAAQVAVVLTITFALALGRGGGPSAAVPTALGFLFGGTFFLLLVFVSSLLRGAARPAVQELVAAARMRHVPASALTEHLTHLSPLVRFALLRAAGTALIVGLAWGTGVPYPQWAPIVVIASVRPEQMAALRVTGRFVIGSVLGAGLADVVLSLVQDPVALGGLAVAGVFLAFTVVDVSYGLFVFFLTTLTLLLLNIPTSGPTYAVLRVVATLVGAAAALGVSWLSAWLVRRSLGTPSPPPESPPSGAVA